MKKLISAVLSLMMIFNIIAIPIVADAALLPMDSNKANISFVYLGSGTTPASEAMDFPSTSPAAGEQIWIGVQFSNMSRLRTLFNSDKSGGADRSGLNNMTLGVIYDSDILTPVTLAANKLLGFVSRSNYPYDSDNDENLYKYSSINRTGTNGIGSDSEPNNISGTVKSYTQNFGVNTDATLYMDEESAANAPRIFQDNVEPFKDSTVGDEPVIYGYFSFTVKADANIQSGTTVLQAGLGQNIFTIGLGSTGEGDGMALAWNQSEGTDVQTNLKNYFNLTDKDGNPTDPTIDLWPQSYTVTYDANGGSYPDSFDNTESVKATNTDSTDGAKYGNPTLKNAAKEEISEKLIPPTGKIFEGWYTAAEGGDKVDTDYKVKADTSLYAHYTNGYAVNFNLNGDGAKYADGTDTLKYLTIGEGKSPAANAIADEVGDAPTRDGYTFRGWYTKKNGSFDTKYTDDGADGSTAITAITGQTDLYAMWDNSGTGTYKLHFDKNGGATDADPNVVGYSSADDTLASLIGGLPKEPTRDDGYLFLGWYKNASGDGEKLTETTQLLGYTGATGDNSETTVYAKWGYVQPDPSDPPHPVDPDNPDPKDDGSTVKVVFDKTDGTYAGGTYTYGTINDKYIKLGETISNMPLNTDMENGEKVFDGWYTQADGKGSKITSGDAITAATDSIVAQTGTPASYELKLYANWIDKVTIKYDVNGLPGATNPADQTVLPTAKFTPHTVGDISGFDSANYDLVEWNTEANGSGTSFTAGTEADVSALNGKTTLYAIWNYKGANNVTVVFNGNDTTNKPAELTPNDGEANKNKYTLVRQAGTTIAPEHMPEAKRTDYNFDHWDLDKAAAAQGSATAEATQQAITVTAPTEGDAMNVYAIWRVDDPTKQAVVNFDLKATDTTPASIDSITIAKGDSLGDRMPANPTRTGYSFDKWTNNDGGADFDKDTVVTESSTTVNANWTQENTVTYDRNGLPDSIEMPQQVKGAPGTAYTVAGIDFNGASYEFVEWNTEANGTGVKYEVNASKTIPNENLTLYAIWNSTDPNAKSITFLANDSTTKPATLTPHDTDNTKVYTMKRMPGTIIQANQMPGAERDDYELDHWGKTATEALLLSTQTQEAITVGTEDITRYAIWDIAEGVTSHTVSFALHGATTPTTIADIIVADGDTLGDRMPADPERTNATFKQWTTGTSKTAFDATAPITSDITLDANWTIKVDVKFTTTQFDYDGDPHTPITDGNYNVFLKGTTSNPLSGLTLSAEKYLKVTGKDETQDPPTNITEDLPAGVTVPVGGGEYTYQNLTLTEAGGDGFTEYDINTIPDTFTINAKDIELTIDKNYQYIGSGETIQDITITSTDTDVNTAITGGDIKVTFTDKDGNTTNTMPTAFGHYTIKVESTNGSYNVTKVKDNYNNEGDAIPLYLINLQREIKVDYIDGTNKNATDVYTTVTLTKPTTLNSTSDAKTTLAGQTPALDVPQQGTDFDPPTGMRIKKFVTGTKQSDNTIADPVDFDKDTVISFSETNEPLTIYAIYENADWTLKFSDTKTSPAAETFVDYTVDAEKSVKDGLKKKGSTEVTDPAEKVLPSPTAAPDNMMFGGWTTDQSITTDATLTMTDLNAGGKYADKMFTDETVPTAEQLGTTNGLTVYAVYVKSSDATLKSALFKEILVTKDDDGNVTNEEIKDNLKYVDALPTPADDTIKFDPDTDTYNIIVKNDFEKLLADLEPTQPGATISVKVNDNTVANETENVPAGHTQAKPGVNATTYDKDNDTNSTNTIVVTVTAPDGTTKDYTFNVLRYAKAEIKLNYGNSPHGEIMKADNIAEADKVAAKAAFDNSDPDHGNLKYDAAYTPTLGITNVEYTQIAWRSYDKNYDQDENAIFVYEASRFVDPGLKFHNELDKEITDISYDRTLVVKKMGVGEPNYSETASVTDLDLSVASGNNSTVFNLSGNIIRPDVYTMNYTYTFTDLSGNSKTLQVSRPVIVLSKRGDIQLTTDPSFNANDMKAFATSFSNWGGETAHSLFAYRVCDLQFTTDPTVNANDYKLLVSDLSKYSDFPYNQYYRELPTGSESPTE